MSKITVKGRLPSGCIDPDFRIAKMTTLTDEVVLRIDAANVLQFWLEISIPLEEIAIATKDADAGGHELAPKKKRK